MQKENYNSRSPFPKFFTLLSFALGVILYIIIKQSKNDKKEYLRGERVLTMKRKVLSKKVNREELVESEIESIKLTDRQKEIVKKLIEKGKMYPSQLQDLLPEVSSRTVRRDMTNLEKKGLVEQKGSTKSTYYVYIGS